MNPEHDTGGPWCPTALDFNGVYVTGSGNWLYCSHVCDMCVSPWYYYGEGKFNQSFIPVRNLIH